VCNRRLSRLRKQFIGKLNAGVDLSASLAITVDGAFEVDL
jgi:hypothetical protein